MEKLEIIETKRNCTLVIEENLENQIRYMCNKFPSREWSGTLFYSIEGSLEEENLVIHAKDFYLQDIGSSSFTTFKRDVSLASFMLEHELVDCFTGLIHSHNSMATFFSETDLDTLLDEGKDMNHFVSLIVNNEGSYKAAITTKVKNTAVGTVTSVYNTFNNKKVTRNKAPFTKELIKVEFSYLNIKYPDSSRNISLNSRINELIGQSSYNNTNRKSIELSNQTLIAKAPEDHAEVKSTLPKTYKNTPNFTNREVDSVVNNIYIRIVSGNIMAIYQGVNNIFKIFCNNMENRYSERFPDFAVFEGYASYVIDFLMDETTVPNNLFYEVVNKIIQKLELEIPKNKYLDTYINLLKEWTK